jgi:nucleoside-diphosphate-sugar epimerase
VGLSHPVAVVGAGFLGRPLAGALAAITGSSGPVLATTRSGTWPEEHVPANITVRALDVVAADPPVIAAALAGARSLVVCYAPGRAQDRRALYIDGTRKLLAAAAELPLTRLVYVSSTSALPDHDAELDDDYPHWPDDPRGRVQREAEALVIEACGARDLPWTILRLGGLYGPGRELGRLYRSAPDAPLPGDGMQPTNLIHRDDAIQAAIAALSLPPDARALVNVVDDDHTPRREIFARLAAERGLPPPTWERPAGAAVIGKRVGNARLKSHLHVTLLHPRHTPGEAGACTAASRA